MGEERSGGRADWKRGRVSESFWGFVTILFKTMFFDGFRFLR